MSDINVHIFRRHERNRIWYMRYICPISGKQVWRSAGTNDKGKAEKKANVWEDELNRGQYPPPLKCSWKEFRERFDLLHLVGKSRNTSDSYTSALNHIERLAAPG